MTAAIDPHTQHLSALLHLEQRAREASGPAELGFVMVNETHGLVAYRQAALWIAGRGVVALSGVPVPEAGGPFAQWLDRLGRTLHGAQASGAVDRGVLAPADAAEWADWLPPEVLWLPLGAAGGLLVARDEPFTEGEAALLLHLGGAYGHAWAALFRATPLDRLRDRLKALPPRRVRMIAAAAVLALLFPVRLSVLAPGEMVPADPTLVRAPLEGVVDVIHVKPNDRVAEGQPLFDLDTTGLLSRQEVAAQALAGAEAEYRQAVQQAVWDPKAKAQLAIVAGRIEERRAELDYLGGQLDRARVKAPAAGIVVFDDPSAWLGRPVSLGEKVMSVTGETDTEVEAWLAVGDAIALEPGAPVTMFLNVSPLSPVHARMRMVGFEAQARPDGTLATRLRATVEAGDERPRVGLRGTVRVDGHRVPLVYWLLRKPLAAIRQWIGV